ncbi:hypothetical protein Q5P01_018491 [Channa striata]|uniref:UPAR/Ly6 domain-containing protein n=1 Tax=Channa striata TaxID=64152 RepID=A0AA88M4J5_CHASR|nr:hypothetical protein Q5P01_018491 [Channa striata]
MGKILFGIVVAVASFILVDSLTCNLCNFGVVGFCLVPQQQTCNSTNSVCYTAKATFPALPSFVGFSAQGCLDNTTSCNTTITSSFLTVNFTTQTTCCSSNNCNQLNSAVTASTMTVTATVGVAVLASVWGSLL